MSTKSQALHPYLHPGPGRTWFGFCNNHHELWLDDREWDDIKKTNGIMEVEGLPEHPRLVVPIMLPCGDIWYSTKECYKRSDGTYFYQ